MSRRDVRWVNKRKWLRSNSEWGPDSSIRYIVESSNTPGYGKFKGTRLNDVSAELVLRDCSNYISFHYSASDEKHYNIHLEAMNKLVDSITEMRDKFIEARESIAEWREGK